MSDLRFILTDLVSDLTERVKTEPSVNANYSTRLLLQVGTLLNAINHGKTIPDDDVKRLQQLRNQLIHTSVGSSSELAPFQTTLVEIANKVR